MSLSQNVVDVTSGHANIHFTLNASDDVSGFSRPDSGACIYIYGAAGNGSSQITGGTEIDPVIECNVGVGEGAVPGMHEIAYVILDDNVYHETTLGAAELQAMGLPAGVSVINDDDVI